MKYKILRPCLWFAVGDYIEEMKFKEYFTPMAINSLLSDGFVEVVIPDHWARELTSISDDPLTDMP